MAIPSIPFTAQIRIKKKSFFVQEFSCGLLEAVANNIPIGTHAVTEENLTATLQPPNRKQRQRRIVAAVVLLPNCFPGVPKSSFVERNNRIKTNELA